MAARIYYTVNLSVSWHQVAWIDEYGNKHEEKLDVGEAGGDHLDRVHKEFRRLHPGAVYLPGEKLSERLALIAAEKEKLAAWQNGASL